MKPDQTRGGGDGDGVVVPRQDALAVLRRMTPARVALGRVGTGLPTRELLQFQADHALARDAVHARFDIEGLVAQLSKRGLPSVVVESGCTDRAGHLRDPEAGRRLSPDSRARLAGLGARGSRSGQAPGTALPDVALIVSDGLSAAAANRYGPDLLSELHGHLVRTGVTVSPVVVVPFGRVGLLDDVGEALGARSAAIVIGERPGLSAPDNLSIYFEHAPRPGLTDADRNCLSNISPAGLPPAEAARRAAHLVVEALRRGTSGTGLTLEFDAPPPLQG